MKQGKLLRTATLGLLFALAAPAAEMHGYLIDKMCAQKFKNGDAAAHDKSCLSACAKHGYGLLTADGKFVPFDKEGNKKAQQAIKASDKKDDFKVNVDGVEKNGVLQVKSLNIV